MALPSDWLEVEAESSLPVPDGTEIRLKCVKRHVNLGGRDATCREGQVVPHNEPPLCTKLSRFIRVCKYKEDLEYLYIDNFHTPI